MEDWEIFFNRKVDHKIKGYKDCPLSISGGERIIDYLNQNRNLLKNRPQCFQHGDYHIGNMMMSGQELVIIDFDRFDFGDPWEEFNRIVWCAQKAPFFATGMVDGYFDFIVPQEFWQCLAFYIGSNTISSIYWAIDFGQSEVDVMMKQSQDVLLWYDNYKTVFPSWYQNCKQEIWV